MTKNLKKAEQTAVDAVKVVARVTDFGESVLRHVADAVVEGTGFRFLRGDPVRHSMRDGYVVRRVTGAEGSGCASFSRYLFVGLAPGMAHKKLAGGERQIPIICVSLASREERAPALFYGLLSNISGRERSEDLFIEYFVMWLNENANELSEKASNESWGRRIDLDISGRAEPNKLKATLSWTELRLFKIDSDNVGRVGEDAASWFLKRLEEAGAEAERSGTVKKKPVPKKKRAPKKREPKRMLPKGHKSSENKK